MAFGHQGDAIADAFPSAIAVEVSGGNDRGLRNGEVGHHPIPSAQCICVIVGVL